MRKVKILLSKEMYIEDDYRQVYAGHISEWEELSDEDFKLFEANWYDIRSQIKIDLGYQYDPFYLTGDIVPISERLVNVKSLLEKAKEEAEKKKAKEEARKVAAKLKKQAKDEASQKALYEALKAKFEPGNLDFDDPNERVGQYRG